MPKYESRKVFTPTTPARLSFIEREGFNSHLVNALRTPGKQIVVYGHSGSGKTTVLVNKLNQLYSSHITTRCMSNMTFEQLVLDAFDQLDSYYTEKTEITQQSEISTSLSATYIGIKSQLGSKSSNGSSTTSQRILPPQLTAQNLSKFIGEVKCCWVLEDFHKIDKSERDKLAQIMKVFMDQADDYGELKVIAIGAVDTARLIVEYDPEMKNRVAEIRVPLMKPTELRLILEKGGELLNIRFDDDVKTGIVSYSNGIASVCHALALNCCIALDVDETSDNEIVITKSILNKALNIYIKESSDTLKSTFDIAFKAEKVTKYDNYRIIIRALSSFEQDGAAKGAIINHILEDIPQYSKSNVAHCLTKLQQPDRGALIKYEDSSKLYSFTDPIYRVYALAYFNNLKGDKMEQMTFTDIKSDVVMSELKVKLELLLETLSVELAP